MKIPYGISNFKSLITEGYLYVDKTPFITSLEEQGKYNILLRPRRFGKTLFLSTLRSYYDIRCQDEFDSLFGHLAIARNPTPLKNRYRILAFDFSGIETGSQESVRQGFSDKVEYSLRHFLIRYGYNREDVRSIEAGNGPTAMMNRFFNLIGEDSVYLFIDEYDHFANAVLGESLELFSTIVGKGGFVRAFYEVIKTATMEGIVDRLFITGVTSITLDSMTSGFNIADNITFHRDFNRATGFTAQETEEMIQPFVDACGLNKQEVMNTLGRWYNGYRFSSRADEKIFNPDMVLYFLRHFDTGECRWPEQMLDDNIASDYGKIMRLFGIGDRERNFETLEELIVNHEIIGRHKGKLDLDMHKPFERDDFISLLLYMGFITISGTMLDELCYRIPNYVIEKLYYRYFKTEIELRSQITLDNSRLKEALRQLALHNNIKPLLEEIRKVLALFSNRDFMRMDEKHIKTLILTLLYQSEVYFIRSEAEINKRYPDILLLERKPIEVRYQFLFELKFSKKKDGEKGMEAKRAEGIAQISGYQELADISCLPKLQSYLLLTDGTEIEAVATA